MKPILKLISFFLIIAITATSSYAQEDVSDYRSPGNPATVIIGNEPSTILRPTTPQAIGTTIRSFVDEGKIKPNMSLEANPYWLQRKNKDEFRMTYEEFVNVDDEVINAENPNLEIAKRSMLRNLAFSMATVEANDIPGVNLGFGIRTKLFEIFPTKQVTEIVRSINEQEAKVCYEIIEKAYGELGALVGAEDCSRYTPKECSEKYLIKILNKIKGYIENRDRLYSKYLNDKIQGDVTMAFEDYHKSALLGLEFYESRFDEIIQKALTANFSSPLTCQECLNNVYAELQNLVDNNSSVEKLYQDYQILINNIKSGKRKFSIDIAYANLSNSPDFSFNKLQVQKHMYWLSVSFAPSKDLPLEFTALYRQEFVFPHSIDSIQYVQVAYGGMRISFTNEMFNLSIEGVGNISKQQESDIARRIGRDYRITIDFEYRLNDLIYFNFAFGRTFRDNVLEQNVSPILLVGGINVGLPSILKN